MNSLWTIEQSRCAKSATYIRNFGKRISEGWACGVLILTFEMCASYLNASWWLVDSRLARMVNKEFARASPCRTQKQNWSRQGESKCSTKTKHCDAHHKVLAQCQCQCDETQPSTGTRISSEGCAYGVLTVMFELCASYLRAYWWMVDSCRAKICEQGMHPGFSAQ